MNNENETNSAANGMIAIEMEDGSTQNFVIDAIFLAQDHQYIALLQADAAGAVPEDAQLRICRYNKLEGGKAELIDIENAEELEQAETAYRELAAEFDEENE